jgi:hypothetical protein
MRARDRQARLAIPIASVRKGLSYSDAFSGRTLHQERDCSNLTSACLEHRVVDGDRPAFRFDRATCARIRHDDLPVPQFE